MWWCHISIWCYKELRHSKSWRSAAKKNFTTTYSRVDTTRLENKIQIGQSEQSLKVARLITSPFRERERDETLMKGPLETTHAAVQTFRHWGRTFMEDFRVGTEVVRPDQTNSFTSAHIWHISSIILVQYSIITSHLFSSHVWDIN